MQPTISIITVVYNGEAELEGTIQSVLKQTYPAIEYVIIDGASKDGTLDLIKKYEPNIDFWKSEPDKGLYDAMNKGMQHATGDFVLFLNAGDRLYAKDTLDIIFSKCKTDTDILYGEVMMVDDARQPIGTRSEITTRQLPKNLNWKSLQKGMVVCHQAFIPRRTICPPYMMDNLAADIDWVIECLKKSRSNVFTDTIIAEFLVGGVSKQRHQQSLKDRFAILQKHYGVLPNLWNHGMILLRAVWFRIIRTGKERY